MEEVMAKSFRVYYPLQSGRNAHNFNIAGATITNRSAVIVTAAPGNFSGPPGLGYKTNFDGNNERLNVHGPDVWVSNVVAHGPEGGSGGVEFVLTVAGTEPTDVAVTITVLDEFESFFQT
jgi:hypothetical protein